MKLKITTCIFLLALFLHAGASYAAQVAHECSAEKFIPCSSFRAGRTIGELSSGASLAGFTRRNGKWTITVSYEPAEKCAKVSLSVDTGPIDFAREYERVFINGGGSINDSGSFMHEVDNLESALRVHGHCLVPADEPQTRGSESTEGQELDEERERLALEEERERLALQGEEERLALEEERARLEEEQRLEEERERQRLAQLRRERERQRLAEERRERERQRLAQERRERARRIAQQRREQERLRAQRQREADDTAAAIGLLGAFLHGLSGGSGSPGGMGFVRSPSSGGGGSSCEQARRRGARAIRSQRMSTGSQCSISRSALRMYQSARRYLANGGCPAHEVRQYDRAIAQTRRRVRAACY